MPNVQASEKLKVFISYSRKDLSFSLRIVQALKARGLEPKLDTQDLPTLADWRRELLGFIQEADAVVFVVSPRSIHSPECSWEVGEVLALNKRLAPIVLERVSDDSVPESIAKINYLFFDEPNDFESQADRLAQALLTDQTWIKEHTRFGELARHWSECKRDASLLLRGREIEAAERWIASRPPAAPRPTELHRQFIALSRRDATRRQQLAIIGSLLVGAIGIVLATIAYWQRGIAIAKEKDAREQRAAADSARTDAEHKRDLALRSESVALASQAASSLERGKKELAFQLASRGLPRRWATPERLPDRPINEAPLIQFYRAYSELLAPGKAVGSTEPHGGFNLTAIR
jgi:TIR domain